MRFRVIGPGRAGASMADALSQRGWSDLGRLGRGDDPGDAGVGVEVVIVAVPDDAIAAVAATVEPGSACLVHLSGAATLDRLAPHARRASVHPLVSLPDPTTGARRLQAGATFAVAGDPVADRIVDALGGTAIEVPDDRRAIYHAAAAVAANHLVALCAQVERLAGAAGLPPAAYWELMARTLDNVATDGPAAALTGPAARGDLATLTAHLDAIDTVGPGERPLYLALADAAAALAGRAAPSPRLRAGDTG